MYNLEKFYNLEKIKRFNINKPIKRSVNKKAKLMAKQFIKEASILYTTGNNSQALSVLEQAVKLVPNDYQAYHLAALIHEDNGNIEKSLNGYFLSAMLSNKTQINKYIWKKVYELADKCSDNKKLITAIDRMYRKNPSLNLLEKKMNILAKTGNNVYKKICCEIDMMIFSGMNINIFNSLESHNRIIDLTKIGKHLFKLIKKCNAVHIEEFLLKSLFLFYKIKKFEWFTEIYEDYYVSITSRIDQTIYFQSKIAYLHIYILPHNHTNSKIVFNEKINKIYCELLNIIDYHTYDKKLIINLIDFFILYKLYSQGIKLCEHIIMYINFFDLKLKLGELYKLNLDIDIACKIYTEILEEYPLNMEVKAKLFEIYNDNGHKEIANQFKNISEIVKEENNGKDHYRYQTKQCEKNQTLYNQLFNSVTDKLSITNILVDEFFTNKFVIINDKKFASFFDKSKSLMCKNDTKIISSDYFNKKNIESAKKHIILKSLRGLELIEWKNVLKIHFLNLICDNKIYEIKKFLLKTIKVRFWENCITEFDLLGLKIGLIYQDIEFISEFFKAILQKTNYSALNLIFFCLTFLPDAINHKSIIKIFKTAQRFYFLRSDKYLNLAVIDNQKDIYSEKIQDIPCLLNKDDKEIVYAERMFLNTFFPRFNYISTIKKIDKTIKSIDYKTQLVYGISYINNCMSRILTDKYKFAMTGVEIIKKASENINDLDLKNYNLGRTYHGIGMVQYAERYYIKCIDSSDIIIRKMALFNLSLLWNKNKSKSFMITLMSKFSKK